MSDALVVSVANPMGTSAKTSTLAALAHLAHLEGQRVLTVDTDPQANLTDWVSGLRDTAGITQVLTAVASNDPARWPGVPVDEVLADRRKHVQRAIQTVPTGFDLIPADHQLRATVRNWASIRDEAPEMLLAEGIAAVADLYDLVLIDCKGDLAVLTEAALEASDEIIGVCQPDLKTMAGLPLLAAEAEKLQIGFRAVVPVKIQHRNRGADADDLYQLMQKDHADRITSPIRHGSNLDAAYSMGQPITAYEPNCGVSQDLRVVYRELRDRGVLP